MAEHTPGPWYMKPAHGEPNTSSIVLNDGRGGWVARIQHNGSAVEERQIANAHLIAAAPDLYVALGYARQMIIATLGEGPHLEYVDAALAKARGEAAE